MMKRRSFLKSGSLTALALGLNAFSPPFLKRRILAGPSEGRKKIVFLFQRGGNDGVNTVIPRGDPEYNKSNRPTLFIPESRALDLGNGFAQLHPALEPMLEIYNHSSLNGVPGPGNLAIIHRVGYRGQSQSHFDSQQFWENGSPGEPYLEEGMFYRHVAATLNPRENGLVAASVTNGPMVSLKGDVPIPTVSDLESFRFAGSQSRVRKFLGALPTAPAGSDGSGVLGLYGGPRDDASKPYRELVYGTGRTLADTVSTINEAVEMGPYEPENGAEYEGRFGEKLAQVAMLMKRTPVQVLGVNLTGWDTHTNQGRLDGEQPDLLALVARGFRALSRDLADQWDDLLLVTMTEFGRTSVENASRGTDHAYACVVFVAGGAVQGGVYNCDAATWGPGDLLSQSGRYVAHRTDFRAVFAEVFREHFGDGEDVLAQVLPSYAAASVESPEDFVPLGFLGA